MAAFNMREYISERTATDAENRIHFKNYLKTGKANVIPENIKIFANHVIDTRVPRIPKNTMLGWGSRRFVMPNRFSG